MTQSLYVNIFVCVCTSFWRHPSIGYIFLYAFRRKPKSHLNAWPSLIFFMLT